MEHFQEINISENFIGLISISKELGAHLSAVNIMSALENFFVKNEINRFVCMSILVRKRT